MPTQTVATMIYLGNFADVDTNETDIVATNAADLIGTYDDLQFVTVTMTDQDDDGRIDDNDEGNTSGDQIAYDLGSGPQTVASDSSMVFDVVVTLGDGSTLSFAALVFQTTNGDVFFTANNILDNVNIQSVELATVQNNSARGFTPGASIDNSTIVCFASGTLIDTMADKKRVEDLCCGDLVMTEYGPRALKWIHCQKLAITCAKSAPVRIAAGALGRGFPSRALYLSPQHRVLVRNMIAVELFGRPEVFVAAKALIGAPGISQVKAGGPVTYWHVALQEHGVIFANDVATESFFCGKMALQTLTDADRHRLFCALGYRPDTASEVLAYPCPNMRHQRELVRDSQRKRAALYQPARRSDWARPMAIPA